MVIKFGKHSGQLLRHKQGFFKENDRKLAEFKRLAEVYLIQPKREVCKNCDNPLGEVSFMKLGVKYIFCSRCGHLNGAHKDTEAFCSAIYTEGSGRAYSETYTTKSIAAYEQRVVDIYIPKARFLIEALEEQGETPMNTTFVDLGAGSGYFVAALLAAGIRKVTGYEVSESQVDLANTMLEEDLVKLHNLKDIVDIVTNVNAEVISLIGVLEHLQKPRHVLKALTENRKVRYIFLSLPLFSPSVFFEMVFPEVMPRQLVGGHTHLYTESSIDHFCKEFCLERVAEWWFGTDMVDLFRNISITLEKCPESQGTVKLWEAMFIPAIDDIQLALDKHWASSEVHMLLKIKK